MADIYVRSTDGSDSDNGSTWALAKATLTGAAAIAVAGDTIYVSHVHAESTAGAISFILPGTLANPNRIICVNDGAEPPTELATTATVAATGNSGSISIVGVAYVYGITFDVGTGGSGSTSFSMNTSGSRFEKCNFRLNSTSAVPVVQINGNGNEAIDCGFRFSNVAQNIVAPDGGRIIGGSILSGTAPDVVFDGGGAHALISGMDLSTIASTANLFVGGANDNDAILRNCKLPTSWNGSLVSTPMAAHRNAIRLHNSDYADTNYRMWKMNRVGSVRESTAFVMSGGASDGATQLSWHVQANSLAAFPFRPLISDEIVKWNETINSTITVALEMLHDGAGALQNNEVWFDVEYLGSSGSPLSLFATCAMSGILATPSNHTSSSAFWTTTGMSSAHAQKMSVAFMPREKGIIHGIIRATKPDYAIYVDPVLRVS